MKKILRFLPALIWMGVIFYFSSRQTTGIGHTYTERFLILKSLHLIEYAILFILINYGFKRNLKSIVISYIYACSDELHQYFVPGRTGKLQDTLIDLVGIIIGFIFVKIILQNKIIKKLFN